MGAKSFFNFNKKGLVYLWILLLWIKSIKMVGYSGDAEGEVRPVNLLLAIGFP